MAKRSLASAMDLYLAGIKTNADKMVVCSAEPTTYTEANVTFALASVAMVSGDFTIETGDGGGNAARKIVVAAKPAVAVVTGGTATHVALLDTVNSLVPYVATCTMQELVAGKTVNLPEWKIEIGAPT